MQQNEDEALAPEGSLFGNSQVSFVSTIEDAVREADLAIDCVPDELESKLEILWLLDRMSPPRTVFATPTTRLSIADLAACTYRQGKCVAIAAEARDLAGNYGRRNPAAHHRTNHSRDHSPARKFLAPSGLYCRHSRKKRRYAVSNRGSVFGCSRQISSELSRGISKPVGKHQMSKTSDFARS